MKTKTLNIGLVFVALAVLMFANVHSACAQSGGWTTNIAAISPRALGAAATVGGKVYMVGGGDYWCGVNATLQVYDPATNVWVNLVDMPTARYELGATELNGQLYAIAGNPGCGSAGDAIRAVEVYDPVSNSWSSKALLPSGSWGGAVASANGKIYVIGGFTNSVYCYDPNSDSWSLKTPMPAPYTYNFGTVAVVNDIIYVIGGGQHQSGVYAYNPVADSWTVKASMPTARASCAGAAMGGIIYVAGGGDTGTSLVTVEAYNPATDAWSAVTPLPFPFATASAAAINGILYVMGGFDNNNETIGTVVAFTPVRPTVTITSPTPNQRITNNFNVTMTGKAKDTGSGVAQVFYKLNGSAFQLAEGATNWMASLTLVPGTNKVEVKAVNFSGNESSIVPRTFFTVVPSLFSLATNGFGMIISTPSTLGTPTNGAMLEVGRSYKIQAVPAVNNIFSNWTGSAQPNAILTFVMQSNMTLTANIVTNHFIAASGAYNGLFYETNGVAHQSAGFVNVKVKTNLTFSAKLYFDGDAISGSGKFNVDGTGSKTFSRSKQGKSDVTLALALDFVNGTDKAAGTVSTTNWMAELQADRATFSGANPATAYANKYTMLIPGFADPADGPVGYGYGLVTVSSDGSIKLATGGTADGMTLSQSVPISKNGQWPFYVPIYKSVRIYTNGSSAQATNNSYYLGSVLGWLTFTNNAPTGMVSWVKTGWTNAVYPNGFTNESVLLGSRYLVPATGTRAIDITSGTLTLTNGNLSTALTRNILINPNNTTVITPTNHAVKLSLAAKTGLLSGSFQHPDNTNKVTMIKGAVLQEQNVGGGFFVGTNQGGLMLLE